MNVDEIRGIIEDRFPVVMEVEQTILKAHSIHAGNPYALWIFDCSQAITREEFDLRTYQDRLLRTDFHRIPGSIQWNLYCYFLCDEEPFKRLCNRGLVDVVEHDHEYARKFVRTPAMLRGDLASLKTISAEAKSELPKDVGSMWQNILSENGLAAVCSNLPYTDTVHYIKSGRGVDTTRSDEIDSDLNAKFIAIDAIDAIDLGNFRQRPKTRCFEFGSCNLIHGVNGSGKTSLLEAIEAWMCGKHRRNPDADVKHDCLKLKIQGVDKWQSGPSDRTTLYRRRDHLWYGNYQARKNDLCFNFARFSFYDSDAAARFEISDDDREIQAAMSRLVIGEAAAKLAERMSRLTPILKREEREYSNRVRSAEETIQSTQASISALEKPTTLREKTYEHFIKQLKSAGWRDEEPTDSTDACMKLLDRLNNIGATIEHVLRELAWLREPSYAKIERQMESLSLCDKQIDTLVNASKQAQEEKAAVNQQVVSLGEMSKLCARWLEYFEAGANHLPAMTASYNKAKLRKQSLLAAKQELARINLHQYAEVDEVVTTISERIQVDLEKNADICTKARATVTSLEKVHGRIEGLFTEVRARAAELFEVDVEAVVCPVCGAQHQKGKLRELVHHQVLHVAVPELQKANTELRRLTDEQKNLNQVLRDLATIQAVSRDVMGVISTGDQPVKALVAPILSFGQMIAQCDVDSDQLQRNRAKLEAKGFSEQELHTISEHFASIFPDMASPSPTIVAQKRDVLQKAIESGRRRQGELSFFIDNAEQKKRTHLSQHLDPDNITVDAIKIRIAQLAASKDHVDALCEAFAVEHSQPLSGLFVRLNSLRNACETFVRLQQKDESLARIIEEKEDRIRIERKNLLSVKPIHERLKKAIAVLEDLETAHGPDRYVQNFFSDNLRQISDLFGVMHAPRDFEKVVWEAENPMAIRAVRKSDSAVCSVSKLSSGQRNALSLAIFLTMNRKITNAPSLILLDDPVAHVDDLNIVSFFDCLREMLLGCKRQVFFATASSKTANLFAKKFDFLGNDEFRSFQLVP